MGLARYRAWRQSQAVGLTACSSEGERRSGGAEGEAGEETTMKKTKGSRRYFRTCLLAILRYPDIQPCTFC